MSVFEPGTGAGARIGVVPAWAVMVLFAAAAAGQTIAPVSPVPGGGFSRAYGVNASGTAAAGYSDNASSIDNAVRWTSSGGTGSMGFLPGGGVNSYAQAIDGSGTVLAGYGDSFGPTRAFRWTTSGGYQVLPYAIGTTGFNRATGISQSGNQVVGTSGVGGSGRAFLWDASSPGLSLNLGVVSGQSSSGALAISGDGGTVVGASGSRAFRWTSAGGMQDLGSLPGQVWAMAEAVNSNGTVITGRYNNGLGEFGFRWTSAGGMVALPQTPAGCAALRPRAVNGDGTVIIGQVADNNAGLTAFIWTPQNGTQLLGPHLQARTIDLTGWQLTDATGISPDGTAMCGQGNFNGSPVGWVVRGLTCPQIFGSGYSNPSGCRGSTVTFGATILGLGFGVQWQWYKNGVPIVDGPQPSGSIISGAASSSMTLQNFSPGDGGMYQIAVSASGACQVFGSQHSLADPFPAPTIITQPTDTTACVNGNPFLFAAANPGVGSAQYRWQRRVPPFPNVYADIFDGPTGNGSTYLGTGTTTFSILNAQPGDSERYRCIISDSVCGAATQVSTNRVLLTVYANTSIAVEPADTSACPGDNDAAFTVVAAPAGAPFTYQWQKHQPPFPNVYANISDGPTGNGGSYGGTQTATLTISGLFAPDFDRYRCLVTGPCGGQVSTVRALLSAVPEASVTSGPTGGAGCPGGSASLLVTATPAGSTYQWQKYVGPCVLCYQNVANGPTGNGGTYSGAQSPTLTINGLNILDTVTTFRCIVTGPCGITPAASADGAFTLQGSPVIQTQPVGGPVCRNGSKQLSVALAPGNSGTVSYQWWRYVPAFPIFAQVPSGALPSGAVAAGAQTPTLTLSNFKAQDAGQYYCLITGSCGITPSAVATLTLCIADFNCSGTVSVQDIFDFLAAYFANSPSADVNGSNTVSVQDIFDFMALYFAGC